MTWTDYAVIAAVVLIVASAFIYIIRAKKKGQKCIGCPYSGTCGKSACHACTQPNEKDSSP